MSARRHSAARSRVREWHMVTVALACWSSSEIGLPTIMLRPRTTALAPSIGISCRRRISMMPRGVQEKRPGSPRTRRPAFMGPTPSTSLVGSIASATAFGAHVGRQRQLDQDAVHGAVGVEGADQLEHLGFAMRSRAGCARTESMPDALAGAALALDVGGARRVARPPAPRRGAAGGGRPG